MLNNDGMRFWVCSSAEPPIGYYDMQKCLEHAKKLSKKTDVSIIFGYHVEQYNQTYVAPGVTNHKQKKNDK